MIEPHLQVHIRKVFWATCVQFQIKYNCMQLKKWVHSWFVCLYELQFECADNNMLICCCGFSPISLGSCPSVYTCWDMNLPIGRKAMSSESMQYPPCLHKVLHQSLVSSLPNTFGDTFRNPNSVLRSLSESCTNLCTPTWNSRLVALHSIAAGQLAYLTPDTPMIPRASKSQNLSHYTILDCDLIVQNLCAHVKRKTVPVFELCKWESPVWLSAARIDRSRCILFQKSNEYMKCWIQPYIMHCKPCAGMNLSWSFTSRTTTLAVCNLSRT